MIVAINLKLDELKSSPDLACIRIYRIYNRILKHYAMILFDGKNF